MTTAQTCKASQSKPSRASLRDKLSEHQVFLFQIKNSIGPLYGRQTIDNISSCPFMGLLVGLSSVFKVTAKARLTVGGHSGHEIVL